MMPPILHLMSFGHRYGAAPAAHVVVDARWLPNPWDVPELREMSGLDSPVQNYVCQTEHRLAAWLVGVQDVVQPLVTAAATRDSEFVTLAVGCRGGWHRSPAVVMLLSEILGDSCPDTTLVVSHRDHHRRGFRPAPAVLVPKHTSERVTE